MQPARPRIAQINQLVELIRLETADMDPPVVLSVQSDPYRRGERESCLGAEIQETWPGLWPGGEPAAGLVDIRAASLENKGLCAQLTAQAARDRAGRKELGTRLARARTRARREVDSARAAWQEARGRRQALDGQAGQALQLALEGRERARRLDAWIKDVRPHGLSRVQDGRGRVFSIQKLEEFNRLRVEARSEAGRQARAAQEAKRLARLAGQEIEQAAAVLEAARERLEAAQSAIREERGSLRSGAGRLSGLRARLGRALERGEALNRLREHHRGLVRLAAGWLDEDLSPAPQTAPPWELLARARDQGRLAEQAGNKALRLARLIQRQEAVLGGLQERAARLARRASSLNREIKRIDKELPEPLGPLSDPDLPQGEARARALSDLATLRARLEELRPQAAEMAGGYQDLIARQESALERAKLLTARWREEGRAERRSLAQAQALLVEADYACRAMETENQALEQGMGDWIAACLELSPPELAAPARRLINRLTRRKETAREAAEECARCRTEASAPLVGNLSRTPARLKPYGNTLRRQRERAVDLERLEGLWRVAEYWNDLFVGDMAEQIRAPLKAENQHLSQLVSDLSLQRWELSERADRLDGELEQTRREHGQALESIDRLEQVARAHETLVQEADQLKSDLAVSRREHGHALNNVHRLEKVAAEHDMLKAQAAELERDLAATRQEQSRALTAIARLEDEAAQAVVFKQKLEHSRQVSGALKQKVLERHGRYRQSEQERRSLEVWRERAAEQARRLAATQRSLDWNKRELDRLRVERIDALSAAGLLEGGQSAGQDMAGRLTARLRPGRSLKEELGAARQEAWRWSRMAADLSAALSLLGSEHRDQTRDLTREIYQHSHQAAELQQELDQLRVLLVAALTFQAEKLPKPSGLNLSPEQVEKLLERLAAARQKLADLGRSTVGQWSLIAALTSGLVLGNPQPPSKATLLEAGPRLNRPALHQIVQTGRGELLPGVTLEMPAKGSFLTQAVNRADLKLDLMPRRAAGSDPPPEVAMEVHRLAAEQGLGSEVLMPVARAACQQKSLVEVGVLQRVAVSARRLASAHPVIFKDLDRRGLAPAGLKPPTCPAEDRQAGERYLDKLYTEYRTLGFSPQQALGALAAVTETTAELKRQWSPSGVYKGKVKPLADIEGMDRETFLQRMAPYIADRAGRFLRSRGEDFTGDLAGYARSLAADMYAAAEMFNLPVSILMAIAHQETWYTNVLGDQNRSASPFHIFNPTKLLILESMARAGYLPPPRGISLERHLTMATFMAAFHLRELMVDSWVAARGKGGGYVDMNRVMWRYNGSSAYAGRVAGRQREQSAYLKKLNKTSRNTVRHLTPRISLPNL